MRRRDRRLEAGSGRLKQRAVTLGPAVTTALFAATVVVACGGDEKEEAKSPQQVTCPPGQYYDGQYCRMDPNQQQQPGTGWGDPNQPPPANTAPAPAATTPPAPPVATAAPGPAATPVDPSMAAAATPVIQQIAQQSLPAGAQPLGSPIAGQFQQGQSLEHQIQMQPGKCYTIVAAAVPPVQNVDLQLVPITPLPGMNPVLAQDSETGPTATIGKKPNCFKWAWPAPTPMKLIVTVSAGQGVAAAQVYEQ